MKKAVVFTQRVEIVEAYQERRDCADQRIADFLAACGFLPIPAPNQRGIALGLVQQLQPAGIVLTGGNDLVDYGGNAPERDGMEAELIAYGLQNRIPIYGFCRGMQRIATYFGCVLERVAHHVGVSHVLQGQYAGERVNSYHNLAIGEIKKPLMVTSIAEDGVIESIAHESARILGTMWHPERERPYRTEDMERVKELFQVQETTVL